LQYRIAASDVNIANLVRLLVDKYADGERRDLSRHCRSPGTGRVSGTGRLSPRHQGQGERWTSRLCHSSRNARGTIGLLLLRSYILSGDTGHYNGVIRSLERRGFNVVPVFSAGLDMRGPIDAFLSGGRDRHPDRRACSR
jgi:magnesium chelatase subunit H